MFSIIQTYVLQDKHSESPAKDLVTPIQSKSLILEPVIIALEQIAIESSNITEPKSLGHIGLNMLQNVNTVPCQMALVNVCLNSVEEAAVVEKIIIDESCSTAELFSLHNIGTKIFIGCLRLFLCP